MEKLLTLSADAQLSILGHIASQAEETYWLLRRSIPRFRRAFMNAAEHINYLKQFGYDVEVDCGITCWFRRGIMHRIDGPAVVSSTHKAWYRNGRLHRKDGPAVLKRDIEKWYVDGIPHRVGGPAIRKDDREKWYVNGKLHRDDGPAIMHKGSIYVWFRDGKLCGVDGEILE